MSRIRLIAAVLIAGSLAVVEFRSLAQSTSQHQPGSGLGAQGSGQETPVSPSVERAVAAPAPPWARPLAEGELESPTGRRPKTLWTGRRQAIWEALVRRPDAYWTNVERSAGLSGTSKTRYADLGQWATVAYQVTGSSIYAEKAWARISRKINKLPSDRNFTREHLVEYAWMYDWLKPALSEERRRQYIDMMNSWCLLTLNRVPGKPWGTRTGDSDETVGHYFGLALWAAVSGEENPQATGWLNESLVGGFQSTGANRKSWRNAVSQYVRSAKGGVWVESSEYNLGTLRLLLIGAEAIRTATGRDDFPEVTALVDQIAAAQLHELTSDLKQAYQWGDLEHPRSLQMNRRAPLLAVLSGLTRDGAVAGRVLALLKTLPWEELPPREFILYDPSQEPRPWDDQPLWYAAQGVGMVFARDTWDPRGSLFGAYMPNRFGLDHEVRYLGDFQLYRDGEWALTHPLGYDATEGELQNAMLIGGGSGMREARGLVETGAAADGIVYVVGSTGGSLYAQWDIAPPPAFLHEWTRSLVYMPSQDGVSDIVIVHDRVLMDDPRRLPRYGSYSKSDRRRMDEELSRGLKQWIMHMPEKPQVQGRTVSWHTRGGQSVSLATLLPEQVTHLVFQEGKELHMPKYVHISERGWQARICTQREGWETFLHVIHVGNGQAAVTLVRDGSSEGVRVVRPGHADRTVLFNATPGSKLSRMKMFTDRSARNRAFLDRIRAMKIVEIR